jgi:hypothetical protein
MDVVPGQAGEATPRTTAGRTCSATRAAERSSSPTRRTTPDRPPQCPAQDPRVRPWPIRASTRVRCTPSSKRRTSVRPLHGDTLRSKKGLAQATLMPYTRTDASEKLLGECLRAGTVNTNGLLDVAERATTDWSGHRAARPNRCPLPIKVSIDLCGLCRRVRRRWCSEITA